MASEEIFDEQINATSSDDWDNYHPFNGRLNANHGWCAAFNDTLREFTVATNSYIFRIKPGPSFVNSDTQINREKL